MGRRLQWEVTADSGGHQALELLTWRAGGLGVVLGGMAQWTEQSLRKPDDPSSNAQVNPHERWKQKHTVCDASSLRARWRRTQETPGVPWAREAWGIQW